MADAAQKGYGLDDLSASWIDCLEIPSSASDSAIAHPPILVAPQQHKAACPADRERPLVLFSANRVLVKRCYAHGVYSFTARAGLGELLRLFAAGFRVGIYTNSKLYATNAVVEFLCAELGREAEAAARKWSRAETEKKTSAVASKKTDIGNERESDDGGSGSASCGFEDGGPDSGRGGDAASDGSSGASERGWTDNFDSKCYVDAAAKRYRVHFQPILNREHNRERIPGQGPMVGGKAWDLFKPLGMHVADLRWTVCIDDKDYRALDVERHRWIFISSTQDQEAAARDGGRVLKALVDGLLEGLAKARGETGPGEWDVKRGRRIRDNAYDDSDDEETAADGEGLDLSFARANLAALE